jgi:hypothetical protein
MDSIPRNGAACQPHAHATPSSALGRPAELADELTDLTGVADDPELTQLAAHALATGAVRPRGRGKARKSLELIDACADILEEIQPASVRAVCYQLFIRKWLPDMSKKSTGRVSTQLTWAREHGRIPWEWIVDETREVERVDSWADPARFIATVKRAYRRDFWAPQRFRVEVWSEKGTVRGTLGPILNEYGVAFRVMHGYTSTTVAHDIAEEDQRDGRPLIALYCGDWDPSGMSMSELDLPGRIARYGGLVSIERVAINEDDTLPSGLPDYPDLPSFPAADKRGDSRYRWFVENYGHRCWELDALSPPVLRERVEQAIRRYIDWEAWERCAKAEAAEQRSLSDVLSAWGGVAS